MHVHCCNHGGEQGLSNVSVFSTPLAHFDGVKVFLIPFKYSPRQTCHKDGVQWRSLTGDADSNASRKVKDLQPKQQVLPSREQLKL